MRRFADSLYQYVEAVGEVQKSRMASLPTWDDYLANRLHNIAMFPCILAIEYVFTRVMLTLRLDADIPYLKICL
jgi:hypothetical protein